MSSDFETRVLPVVKDYARRLFKNEQDEQDAIGLCWFYYQQNSRRLTISANGFAWYAIRHVMVGRRIPGELDSKDAKGRPAKRRTYKDALDYAWRCAAMNQARDPRPGPDKIAEDKDEMDNLTKELSVKHLALIDLMQMDVSNQEAARLLEVSPGRVSQMRGEIKRRAKD